MCCVSRGTTVTGTFAWWMTYSLTEPKMVRRITPKPRVPMTIWLALYLSAQLTIHSPGRPTSVIVSPATCVLWRHSKYEQEIKYDFMKMYPQLRNRYNHPSKSSYSTSSRPGGQTVLRWHGYLPGDSIVLVVPSGFDRKPGYGSHSEIPSYRTQIDS